MADKDALTPYGEALELLRAAANELSKNYERGGISYNLIYNINAFLDRAEEAKKAEGQTGLRSAPTISDKVESATPAPSAPVSSSSKSEATGVYQQEDLDAAIKRADELHAGLNIEGCKEKVQPTPRTDAAFKRAVFYVEDELRSTRRREFDVGKLREDMEKLERELADAVYWRNEALENAQKYWDQLKAAQSATGTLNLAELASDLEYALKCAEDHGLYNGELKRAAKAVRAAVASTTKREYD